MKIPTTFTIPNTIEGVAGLLIARKWDKAAIVTAYTKPDKPGPKAGGVTPKTGRIYSISEFANLGIAGLSSRETVAAYRKAWTDVTDMKPKPGDTIDTSALGPWPGGTDTTSPGARPTEYENEYEYEATRAGVSKTVAKRHGQNKDAIKAAYKADPDVRKAVREAHEEQVRELASKARKGAGKIIVDKKPISTPLDDAVELMDGVIEEAGRRDELQELLALAQEVHEKASQWAETYSYTGVSDEIDWVHQISHELTEAQWKIASFAVAQEEDAQR